jgi:hypothetical protein
MDSVAGSANGGNFEGVIRIEEDKIRLHVDEVVRQTVEQTLNSLLEAEANAPGMGFFRLEMVRFLGEPRAQPIFDGSGRECLPTRGNQRRASRRFKSRCWRVSSRSFITTRLAAESCKMPFSSVGGA